MMSRTSRAVVMMSVLALSPVSAGSVERPHGLHSDQEPTKGDPPQKANVLFEWTAIMVTTLSTQSPIDQPRLAAIAQLAVFEAVNAISGEYVPYLGTIVAPGGASESASEEAAAIAAAHHVLKSYVPASAEMLDAARERSLAAVPDGPGKEAGIAVGVSTANAMMALRENDGSQPPQFFMPTSTDPGAWQLTPTCPSSGGVGFHLRNLKPFGIETGDQFRSAPPPELTSRRYMRALNEVKELGAVDSTKRPSDRADVARFYAAVLATPLWNAVAIQIAAAERGSLTDHARAFALVNMAINDALVAVFDAKYEYVLWRPETAINAGSSSGDQSPGSTPAFVPFVATPCHPSYPSAHASAGSAARTVLRRIYGERGHAIGLSVPTVPNVTLRYSSLGEITHDIDDARIYGGIHFRFDQRAGAIMGHQVGSYVYKHHLRRTHGADAEAETTDGDATDGAGLADDR